MWLQSSFWSLNLQLDNLTKWWLEVARRSQWRKRCLAPFQPVNLTKRADRHMGPLADLWLCRKDPCAWHDTSLFQCLKCMKCIPVLCFKLSQVQNLRSVSHCAFFESFRMANSDTGPTFFMRFSFESWGLGKLRQLLPAGVWLQLDELRASCCSCHWSAWGTGSLNLETCWYPDVSLMHHYHHFTGLLRLVRLLTAVNHCHKGDHMW